jgi:hypothetical protein
MVGHEDGAVVPVPPDKLQSVKLYLTLTKQGVASLSGAATPFSFVITDIANGTQAECKATFQGPQR